MTDGIDWEPIAARCYVSTSRLFGLAPETLFRGADKRTQTRNTNRAKAAVTAYREQLRARGVVEVPIPLIEFAVNYAINVPERDALIAILKENA